jgi:Fe-S-cluster containining protein
VVTVVLSMTCDFELVQIVDTSLAEAARRSGSWLVCRPGCTQCCFGPFEITQLDAQRLREGLAELERHDPRRARAVRDRARQAANTTNFSDDDPCPALDPETGTCDLYAARPITCRCFGPPVRCDSGEVGICELCFDGASDEEVAACIVDFDPSGLESILIDAVEQATGLSGMTTVAFSLAS